MQRYFPSVGPDIPEVAVRAAPHGDADGRRLVGDVELLRADAYEQGWTTEARVELLRNRGAATVAPAVAVAVRS